MEPTPTPPVSWLKHIRWDSKGLVPVIAQEQGTNDVLMFAWMNREALQKTVELGRAVYFSRSRDKLWYKGEESGHVQTVHEIRMDCDSDVILLKVTQLATSRASPATRAVTAVSSACWRMACGNR